MEKLLEIQSGGDALFPRGRSYYWKAQFLREISAGVIDALLDTYARAPNTSSLLVFQHVGGAIARVPAPDSPYANCDAAFDCFPVAIWDDSADDDANMRPVRRAPIACNSRNASMPSSTSSTPNDRMRRWI